ncbi:MAG TPA: glycine--tRNA ligase [Phycisphaerales bacterium]|nr:glycine--tRNA ligase [Phycisphaerales bacterium]
MTDKNPTTKSMDDIMALCKRRGFVYQASEIYGGINGFWDYGPLGAQLKKNLRDAWWQDVVMNPCQGKPGPNGQPVRIVPVDTCIIQNPKVWEASGHVGGFNDPMVDCRETKNRYRADHLLCIGEKGDKAGRMYVYIEANEKSYEAARKKLDKYKKRTLNDDEIDICSLTDLSADGLAISVGPDATEAGTLTEPRAFNLMFPTVIGATGDLEDNKAYLRPETAQGIFINFKNVVDTTRVGVPFGIAQTGKAFRNEVTPRNFTFRSREFEQMEIEFFCHPDEAKDWYVFWRDWRMSWWQEIGLAGDNLILREHDRDELAHYAKEGAGTSDIEYRFPFTAPGYGELEGIADRTDFDLKQHAEHSGLGDKLKYFDPTRGELAKNGQPKGERYFPYVIEPSAGLDRGVLAILCEAYTPDPDRPSKVFMKFHPRVAPIKAAVFPLVNKDGMPEKAAELHRELVKRFGHLGMIETDAKQSIGKRYARMDEAGCPLCFTIDGQTMTDNTITVRDRDTAGQQRIAMTDAGDHLAAALGL